MLTSILAATAAVGFLGSFHCAFMCGPLLAAGCANGRRASGVAAYLGGRLVSYAFAGAIFGQLGAHAAHCLSATGIQRALLLAVAAAALANGVRLFFQRRLGELVAIGAPPRERHRVLQFAVSLLPRRALPLGLVTGALPCGLLAGGWALAASTGNPLHGALAMALFSLVTAPGLAAGLLVTVPALGRLRTPAWRAASWCALSIWLALRPLLEHSVHHGHH